MGERQPGGRDTQHRATEKLGMQTLSWVGQRGQVPNLSITSAVVALHTLLTIMHPNTRYHPSTHPSSSHPPHACPEGRASLPPRGRHVGAQAGEQLATTDHDEEEAGGEAHLVGGEGARARQGIIKGPAGWAAVQLCMHERGHPFVRACARVRVRGLMRVCARA